MAALAPPAPVLYRDYYNDTANDVFNGTYNAVLSNYVIPIGANNAMTPADLANLVYGSVQHRTPTAFISICNDGLVHLHHRLSRFEPRMGQPASQWDNLGFANSGELFHNNPILVRWRQDHFFRGPQTQAPTVQTIEDAIAQADPNNPVSLFGPYQANEAGTEVVCVRMSMYVPPPYVGIFIGGPITPIQAYQRLRGAIVANNAEQDCEPLIRWLRVALTRNVAGANGVSVLEGLDPTAPVADQALLQHRRELLLQDFPILNQNVQAMGQNLIAQNINQLVADQRQHRLDELARKAAERNKTARDLVGSQVVGLMRLCQVGNEAGLPVIWNELSSCTKAHQLTVLTSAINEIIDDVAPMLPFHVTPALKDRVIKLQFRMPNKDDLSSGLQPFVFGTGSPEELQADQNQISIYQTIFTDQSAPSVSDAQSLLVPKQVSMPFELIQARDMLIRTKIFFSPLLGENHVIVDQLGTFCDTFNMRMAQLSNIAFSLEARLMLPTRIVRWVQIRLNHWFRTQWSSPTNIPAPNLSELFEKIELEENWEPTLPHQYLEQLSLKAGGLSHSPSEKSAPSLAGTDISSLTGGSDTPSASDIADKNKLVVNQNFNSKFEKFRNMRVRHAVLLRKVTVRPPKSPHDPNVEMCPSFHIKAACNTGCSRAADHLPHTEDQDNLLVDWCEDNYKKE